MEITWTTTHYEVIPEYVLNHLCEDFQEDGYDEDILRNEINNVVSGWEDGSYYAWGEEQTNLVVAEVKRRVGGIQISMFDKEEN